MNIAVTLRNLSAGRPILAVFDVTKLCNQQCSICSIWRQQSDDMDLRAIREHAEGLRDFGVQHVFLQGGEPTLRGDLIDIVDIFLKNRIKPSVITNGILFTPELAAEIAARNCNLNISLDTLEREVFRKIRTVDKLDTVVDNINKSSRIRERKGGWAITTTVTELSTLEDIRRLEKFALENGFMYAVRPYISARADRGKRNGGPACASGEAVAIFEYMADRARESNFLARLIYEEHIRYLKGEKMPECDAMKHSFLLQETGIFSACIELSDTRFSLKEFPRAKERYARLKKACCRDTPCFYNCAREVGVFWRNKWKIAANLPAVARQLVMHGNFF